MQRQQAFWLLAAALDSSYLCMRSELRGPRDLDGATMVTDNRDLVMKSMALMEMAHQSLHLLGHSCSRFTWRFERNKEIAMRLLEQENLLRAAAGQHVVNQILSVPPFHRRDEKTSSKLN